MDRFLRMGVPAVIVAALVAVAASGRSDARAAQAAEPAILVGATDGASCDVEADEATAKLLDGLPGTVFAGETYYTGSLAEWEACYGPTWGRHKARTRPVASNHDYITPGAAGYFAYWGAAAGPSDKGYYSYTLGNWKIIVLNSNCVDPTNPIGPDPTYTGSNPCDATSPQAQWLREQLEGSPDCTLAYFHHPLFTSGVKAPGYAHVRPFWDLLYAYGVDVVLNGDDHIYERYARQTPDGAADPARGVRQFIVGTAGLGPYPLGTPRANSQVRNSGTYGVIRLALGDGAYDWEFIPVPGQANMFTDSGSDTCSRGLAPTAAIATDPDPATVLEGGSVTFDGRGSSDDRTPLADLRFDWDFQDDGVWDASGAVVTGAYPDPGSFRARLRVTDGDGGSDTATVAVTVNPFCETASFADDLEPAPDPGWQVETAVNDNPTSLTWQVVTDPKAQSPTQSWFTDATTQLRKDDRLVAPAVDLGPTSRLTFWHRYQFEDGFDGGVLEVSRDGGASWADVTTAGSFLEGGYDGRISATTGSPIAARMAWTGGPDAAAAAMTKVLVDLGGFAGDDVLVRWRFATDELAFPPGQAWWVDDVQFTGLSLPCNRPPTANDDDAATTEGTAVDVAVLANDTDPEDDELRVTEIAQPENGSAAANADGTITYTPRSGFLGTDSFRYTITDGTSTSSARVTVTVSPPPNRSPVAADDIAFTKKPKPVTIDVLANDSDPDGDHVEIASATQPAHGTVTVDGHDSVTYSPDTTFRGTDTFTYTISDGRGGAATARVTVTVH